jgi:hypothetical protein
MKTKLLALYLNTLKARLEDALFEAESLMPEGAARRIHQRHVVQHEKAKVNSEGLIIGAIFTPRCSNESHYQDVSDGQFLALEPIENAIEQLRRDIETLMGEVK